ncbi:MAG: maleate cis-trans isomerase [Deltaproteobacteria bacterium]|nr:maleate cis-trans isomerase [Deltaproteobacteria bacterium]
MELGERGRIGLILPSVNTIAEPEIYSILPEGVTAHTARMDLPVDISNEENFIRMCDVGCRNGEQAAMELATAKVDILSFTFTAGSFYRGAGWDDEIARRMEKAGGAPCIATSSAAVQALKQLGLKWIGVGSPYAVANRLLKTYLEQKGMMVTKIEGLVLPTAVHVGRQPLMKFEELVRAVNNPDADGIFISCTNFATLAKIDTLEKEIGKPVITANQATFWATLRKMGVQDQWSGSGRLLKDF